MCGIAGIVGEEASRETAERMSAALVHRGPDDHGLWSAPGVVFGHRRLTILDLSDAGHQPMSLGPYTLVYNGEIYNFRELREELPGPFVSDSDTEVLLHLYARDGERCVERLHGMFAFALWDEKRRSLFLARDRLGIKPLFYRELEGGLAFASEVKGLLPLGRPAIDPTALRDFFSYKFIPAPKSIYRGICKLRPAHTLTFDDAGLRISRYWHPESSTRRQDGDLALEELESLLATVVPDHTLADVPVGVFLSGGIDSTAVTANLEKPHTFTLGFDVKAYDETEAARRTAEHLGAPHHALTARGVDLEEALEAIPRIYDEPFGDHGAWPTFMISREARREVKVALTGEGGDELFAGYHWYTKWGRHRPNPWNRALAALMPVLSSAGRSAQRRSADGLERYSMFIGPFTPRQKKALLTPELMTSDYDDLWYFREFWREDLDPIKRLQWADLHTYLPDDMMTKVDRASMAVSLEARPPMLDHRLVEFALSLDPTLMHDTERGRVLVRRHLAKRVPPETLTRSKIGFSMPVRRWVRNRPDLLKGALSRLADAGILRRIRSGSFNNEQTWSLLVLDRWLTQTGATC